MGYVKTNCIELALHDWNKRHHHSIGGAIMMTNFRLTRFIIWLVGNNQWFVFPHAMERRSDQLLCSLQYSVKQSIMGKMTYLYSK